MRSWCFGGQNKSGMAEFCSRAFLRNKKEERFLKFIGKKITQDKWPDLTGGRLLRSLGGWAALKRFREEGIRVKGNERILGDSDFA